MEHETAPFKRGGVFIGGGDVGVGCGCVLLGCAVGIATDGTKDSTGENPADNCQRDYFNNLVRFARRSYTAPGTISSFRGGLRVSTSWPLGGNASVANIRVSWPAQVDPDQPGAVPAGSVTSLIAVNR